MQNLLKYGLLFVIAVTLLSAQTQKLEGKRLKNFEFSKIKVANFSGERFIESAQSLPKWGRFFEAVPAEQLNLTKAFNPERFARQEHFLTDNLFKLVNQTHQVDALLKYNEEMLLESIFMRTRENDLVKKVIDRSQREPDLEALLMKFLGYNGIVVAENGKQITILCQEDHLPEVGTNGVLLDAEQFNFYAPLSLAANFRGIFQVHSVNKKSKILKAAVKLAEKNTSVPGGAQKKHSWLGAKVWVGEIDAK